MTPKGILGVLVTQNGNGSLKKKKFRELNDYLLSVAKSSLKFPC